MRSADYASGRYGTQAGLIITPRGGAPVRVPTGSADPLGLGGTAVAVAPPPDDAEKTEALGGPADVIRYSDQVQADRKDDSTGVISVLRTDQAGNRMSNSSEQATRSRWVLFWAVKPNLAVGCWS